MELVNDLPDDLRWNVIKFSTHPVAYLFKTELEDDLHYHFCVMAEGPSYEPNWCPDDHELFAKNYIIYKNFDKH